MNVRANHKNKPRQCSIPEEYLAELADEMTRRYMSCGEIIDFIKQRTNERHELEGILGILESRMYLIAQDKQHTPYGYKIIYCIMTKEKYEKIAEEHLENAKRRLLETISD